LTTARSIIILSILFSFQASLTAQPQFGAKIGRTYMINVEDYYASNGNNISAFIFPLKVDRLHFGIEITYDTKGFLEETTNFGRIKPIEYLSLSLPVKFNPLKSEETDLYAFVAGRYDLLLTSVRNFQDIGGDRKFNSTFGYTAGFGAQYKKIVPNFIIELSINEDLTEFEREKIKNTYLEMKLGVLFDGL
jgi:hypothetical protein